MKIILTTLTALLLLNLCPAQNNTAPLHFNLLSIKDGMPEGTVGDLLQDREGYIWIATQKGLVRYDGYATKVYDFGINDPYGIGVRKLLEDSKGALWAGMDSGLYKYDRANDCFIPFIKKPIYPIGEDKAGNLWVITYDLSYKKRNLILLNPVTKKEVLFGIDGKGKHYVNAKFFFEVFKDKEQRNWMGSTNGLYEYNTKESTFIPHFAVTDSSKQIAITHIQEDAAQPGILYFDIFKPYTNGAVGLGSYNSHTGAFTIFHHDAKDANSIGSDTIWQVQNDSKGRLWVLTAAGLSLFNPATQTFTNHNSNAFKNAYNFLFGFDYGIQEDKQGNLWCTSTNGLFYFNVTTRQFTHYTADEKSKNGLVNDYTNRLMMDRAGILWFGAAQDGLQWVDTKHHRFLKYANGNTAVHVFKGGSTYSFAEAADGTIWLGTKHGLYHWIPQQDSFQFIKFVPNADENTSVASVFCDSKGSVWFSAHNTATNQNGLYCYNPSTGKIINYRYRQNDSTSLSSDAATAIYEDHLGDVWIGTWGNGICRFNRKSQKFTRFPFILNNNTISDTHGALDDDQVECVYEDKAGTLWAGTNNGGLNRFDRQKGTFTSYVGKLPGFACVDNINEDSKGRLWAGTFYGGLFELNKNRDSIKRITEKDGLLYDGVIATAEDNTGNIWVTSQRGISILHPATRQVRTITDIDDFMPYVIQKTSTGNFLMSAKDGFISLNPSDYAPNTNAPVVHIEEMHLSELINDKPKDSAIVAASHPSYQFHYNENRISFRYVGLHYEDAQGTQYAYKLDGYDNDWVNAGTQRTVTYTNLAPGNYTFHVKAANSDGVWSKDESITFTITPPWWATWWFRIFSVIAMIVVVYFIVQKQSRNLKKQNIVLEEKVLDRTKELKHSLEELRSTQAQLIQSEKMASLGQLTAGIAHEIQNPLNFVNNFSEVNKELIEEVEGERAKKNGERDEGLEAELLNDVKQNTEKIIHHGKRADSIVKGMLQHSRASTGKRELTDINALVDESLRLSYHGLRAKDKDFNATINTNFDEGIGKLNIIPQDISRVLLNLFNNAFYAINEKKAQLNGTYEPTVAVSTKKLDRKVEIHVTDNGNGIPQSVINKIFQPFFTTKPTGQGTGLGLSLSYDIIKAHGGEIKVESKEREGTTFIVQL